MVAYININIRYGFWILQGPVARHKQYMKVHICSLFTGCTCVYACDIPMCYRN